MTNEASADSTEAAIERVMRRVAIAIDKAKQYTVEHVRWNDSVRVPENQPSSENAVNAFNATEDCIRAELEAAYARGRHDEQKRCECAGTRHNPFNTDCPKNW